MSWVFVAASERRARIVHACDQCGCAIARGSRYRQAAGRLDGAMTTLREHLDCRAAWEQLNFDLRGLDPTAGAAFLAEDFPPTPAEMLWLNERYPAVAERLGLLQ